MDQTGAKEQRIYIGNLPKDVKLNHLYSILPPGYDNSKLELRHNYDIDKNITSSYAFVNLEGTHHQIKLWCDNASKKSVGGNVLQVQFAKLSFLERLKLEVNSQKQRKETPVNNVYSTTDLYKPRGNSNLVRFDSDHSLSSSETEEETNKSKSLKAPVIEEGDIEMIPENKNSSKAEMKRLESLKERSTTHLNQQKIIRMAMKTVPRGPSNKIVFQDSDEDDFNTTENDNQNQNETSNKRKLFDESDTDNEDIVFADSKPKSKLIRTKISAVDERFRMDSRFFDDESINSAEEKDEDSNENEQGKLLKMADSIIERDPNAKPKMKIKRDNETVIATRFNPLEKKHHSLIIRTEEEEIANEERSKKKVKVKPFKVAKDRFYDVSDNLKDQFKNNENKGFSLLGLFGGEAEVTDPQETLNLFQDTDSNKKSKIKNLKNPLTAGVPNFFNVDEQSESENETPVKEKSKPSQKKNISVNEPFFLSLEDSRIDEALTFFNTPLEETLPHAVISRDLKNIVKKKYLRNKAKAKQFKTKLGCQRKFNNAREGKKKKKKEEKKVKR